LSMQRDPLKMKMLLNQGTLLQQEPAQVLSILGFKERYFILAKIDIGKHRLMGLFVLQGLFDFFNPQTV